MKGILLLNRPDYCNFSTASEFQSTRMDFVVRCKTRGVVPSLSGIHHELYAQLGHMLVMKRVPAGELKDAIARAKEKCVLG